MKVIPMSDSVPRLVHGIHVPYPDVDQMVQCRIIKRHIVGTTIKLVLVEGHQASMVHQVVD